MNGKGDLMLMESNSAPRGIHWSPLRWLAAGELLIFALAAHLALGTAPVVEEGETIAAPALGLSPWIALDALVFGLAMIAVMHALGMHVIRSRRSIFQLLMKYLCSAAAALALLWMLTALAPSPAPFGHLGMSVAFGFALLLVWRLIVSVLIDSAALRRNVLVLGAGSAARCFHDTLRRRSDRRGIEIVGYLPLGERTDNGIHPAHLLHSRTGLRALCQRRNVDEIVIACNEREESLPVDDLLACRFRGVRVTQAATFVERECGRIPLELVDASWWLYRNGFADGGLKRYLKHMFDLCVAGLVLLPAAPVMLACAIAIMVEDGWHAKVLFRQVRVGKHGREFRLVKFRSMREDAESDGVARWARSNDDRVTRVGRFLRKSRLDELPQLFNVLRGEMSLVGPRPERPEFVRDLARQIPWYEQRHAMRPGITGWAQLCYPYGASTRDAQEKLKFDLYYIKNHSLAFDLTILLQTVEVVLFGKGAR